MKSGRRFCLCWILGAPGAGAGADGEPRLPGWVWIALGSPRLAVGAFQVVCVPGREGMAGAQGCWLGVLGRKTRGLGMGRPTDRDGVEQRNLACPSSGGGGSRIHVSWGQAPSEGSEVGEGPSCLSSLGLAAGRPGSGKDTRRWIEARPLPCDVLLTNDLCRDPGSRKVTGSGSRGLAVEPTISHSGGETLSGDDEAGWAWRTEHRVLPVGDGGTLDVAGLRLGVRARGRGVGQGRGT